MDDGVNHRVDREVLRGPPLLARRSYRFWSHANVHSGVDDVARAASNGGTLAAGASAFGSTNAPRLLESIWFGTGARTKIRAWDEAMKMCQAPTHWRVRAHQMWAALSRVSHHHPYDLASEDENGMLYVALSRARAHLAVIATASTIARCQVPDVDRSGAELSRQGAGWSANP